jgi:class 3 adenylate cyclase
MSTQHPINPPPDQAINAARRPKPPPLKEQALAALEADPKEVVMIMIDVEQFNSISRALEALDD